MKKKEIWHTWLALDGERNSVESQSKYRQGKLQKHSHCKLQSLVANILISRKKVGLTLMLFGETWWRDRREKEEMEMWILSVLLWLSKYVAPFLEMENYPWEALVQVIFPFFPHWACAGGSASDENQPEGGGKLGEFDNIKCWAYLWREQDW